MTACDRDDFPYERPVQDDIGKAWDIAIGLQETDGLHPSAYLREIAGKTVSGKLSLDNAGSALRAYYRQRDMKNERIDETEREADLVSHRITELLVGRAFVLDPSMLSHIHAHLFQDLDDAAYGPGRYKTEALVKKETILNGDSVLYGAPEYIGTALRMFFAQESLKRYDANMNAEELQSFCEFSAHIWQVHPFAEGNTRTVATFCALYLDQLGFDIDNRPFAEHARYFRDALVRATYRNAKAHIAPDMRYLIRFFENALHGTEHELKSRDLICQPLFDDPTLLRNIPASEALNKALRD